MKTIVDFLRENKEYKEQLGDYEVLFKYGGHCIVIECECERHEVAVDDENLYEIHGTIQDIVESFGGTEVRFCEECGKPYDDGFTAGNGDWYCCEDCFDGAMNETYGEGKWRPTDEEGYYGGYYEYFDGEEWEDTGIFYTEWN